MVICVDYLFKCSLIASHLDSFEVRFSSFQCKKRERSFLLCVAKSTRLMMSFKARQFTLSSFIERARERSRRVLVASQSRISFWLHGVFSSFTLVRRVTKKFGNTSRAGRYRFVKCRLLCEFSSFSFFRIKIGCSPLLPSSCSSFSNENKLFFALSWKMSRGNERARDEMMTTEEKLNEQKKTARAEGELKLFMIKEKSRVYYFDHFSRFSHFFDNVSSYHVARYRRASWEVKQERELRKEKNCREATREQMRRGEKSTKNISNSWENLGTFVASQRQRSRGCFHIILPPEELQRLKDLKYSKVSENEVRKLAREYLSRFFINFSLS